VDTSFPFTARTDDGRPLFAVVNDLPSRSWNPTEKTRSNTATGTAQQPNDVLDVLRSFIDTELADSFHPTAVPHGTPSYRVDPRCAGYDDVAGDLGRAAVWNKQLRCFIVDAADLSDGKRLTVRGLKTEVADDIHADARQMQQHPFDDTDETLVEDLAEMTDDDPDLLDEAAEVLGCHREGFGGQHFTLRSFQQASAYAVAASRKMICHDMGAGKTCIALAAADLLNTQRL